MAIKDTTQSICQATAKLTFEKSSLPEMSSLEYEEFLSPEKAARAFMLKSRFSGLICKAQQTQAVVAPKNKATPDDDVIPCRESYEEPEQLKKTTTSSRPDRADHAQRERREGDHGQFLKIKKRRTIDLRGEAEDDYGCYRKKRPCHDQVGMRREINKDQLIKKRRECGRKFETQIRKGDYELKRRQEIARQREAARIEINNIKKTVDFDNVGVMAEFERLLRC